MSLRKKGRSKPWVVLLVVAVAVCFTSVVVVDGMNNSAQAINWEWLYEVIGGMFGWWGLVLLSMYSDWLVVVTAPIFAKVPLTLFPVGAGDVDLNGQLEPNAGEFARVSIYRSLDARDLGDVLIRHTLTLDDGTIESITHPLESGSSTLTQGELAGIQLTTSYLEDNFNDHFVSYLTVPRFANCDVNRRVIWKTEVVSAADPSLVSNPRWQGLEFECGVTASSPSQGSGLVAANPEGEPLTFNLLVAGYDPDVKPHVTPWSSGDVLVNTGTDQYSTGNIADGLVSFTVPNGQDSTVTFRHPTFGIFTLNFVFADGFLAITDPANRDQTVNYFENGDGTYALDYFDPLTRLLMMNQNSGPGAPVQGPTWLKVN